MLKAQSGCTKRATGDVRPHYSKNSKNRNFWGMARRFHRRSFCDGRCHDALATFQMDKSPVIVPSTRANGPHIWEMSGYRTDGFPPWYCALGTKPLVLSPRIEGTPLC